MPDQHSKKFKNLPVFEILQNIKNKTLDPVCLSKEERQTCVEALLFEGYQAVSIAGLLKKSDRTIRRDIQDIRVKNALQASPGLTQVLVGELLVNAASHYSRLKQFARLSGLSASEKLKAEFLAWRVNKELIETLDSIGYFIVVPQPAILDVTPKKEIEPEGDPEDEEGFLTIMKNLTPLERIELFDRINYYLRHMDDRPQGTPEEVLEVLLDKDKQEEDKKEEK